MSSNAVLHQVLSRISPRLSKLPLAEQHSVMDMVTANINLPDSNPELIILTAIHAIERCEQIQRLEKIIEEEKAEERRLWEEEKTWNINDREHLQHMEVKLVALKTEWCEATMDSQKLLARFEKQRPLNNAVLMAMTAENLHKLQVNERAELVLLEANTRRLQEIYEAEVDIVVETGQKMGLKGSREEVLHQMEAIARGERSDKQMEANQARLINDLGEQRNYITKQHNILKTKKKRVEQVLDVVEERGLPLAESIEVVKQVQHIAKEECISNPLTLPPVRQTQKAPDTQDQDMQEQKLLLAAAKLAEILQMNLPGDTSLKDYGRAFKHLLNTEGDDLPDFARQRVAQAIAAIENTQIKTLEKQGIAPNFTQKVLSERHNTLTGHNKGNDVQR